MLFFFNDTATTEIYTLSLHDALPILLRRGRRRGRDQGEEGRRHRLRQPGLRAVEQPEGLGLRRHGGPEARQPLAPEGDRKSTRLNSSHANISYAVFCLKKKKNTVI